jgi:excisionase family DNA binding protein
MDTEKVRRDSAEDHGRDGRYGLCRLWSYRTADGQPLVGTKAVAEMLGVSPKRVRRLADAGRMPAPVRFGRWMLWREDDVIRFAAELSQGEHRDYRPEGR